MFAYIWSESGSISVNKMSWAKSTGASTHDIPWQIGLRFTPLHFWYRWNFACRAVRSLKVGSGIVTPVLRLTVPEVQRPRVLLLSGYRGIFEGYVHLKNHPCKRKRTVRTKMTTQLLGPNDSQTLWLEILSDVMDLFFSTLYQSLIFNISKVGSLK